MEPDIEDGTEATRRHESHGTSRNAMCKRWDTPAFFEIITTLTCEINTLAYPQAALFTFCLALLAYNAVSLIKAALRSEHSRKKINDEVSGYYLSLEISRTYDGMMVAIPAPHWAVFRDLSDQAFASTLRELASSVDLSKSQEKAAGAKTLSERQPRLDREASCTKMTMLKGLAHRGAEA
jgi:hypothetical protein